MRERYNILDFETTGFSADYDRVIEVGVVKIESGKVVDKFQELINPGRRIPRAITSLTGITNEMLKEGKSNNVVIPKLKKFVKEELIVAHNASFDARFFHAEMRRVGIKSRNDFLCSMLLARRVYQDLGSHKLSYLCDHLGLINSASHRALGDAEVTFKVLDDICKRVKTISGREIISFEYLEKLSRVPKKMVQEWLREVQ